MAHTHFALRPGAKVLLTEPKLGKQRSSRSDITPGRFDELPGWTTPLVSAMRVVKRAVLR